MSTVPKMDHLICFLPGTLALDVFHHGLRDGTRNATTKATEDSSSTSSRKDSVGNVSALPVDRAAELHLAHKLMQSCVHMYFRTTSDLAPEITRFDGFGFIDDLGAMHNILRPETIESLVMLWRTTKAQIYRNWGQRLLSAFARTRTRFGYASLHNVNEPWRRKDEMPSFFVAETMKYLFLLFSSDSTLPLSEMVLTTEAHPMPLMAKANGTRWLCGSNETGASGKSVKRGKRSIMTSVSRPAPPSDESTASGTAAARPRAGTTAPASPTSPVHPPPSSKKVAAPRVQPSRAEEAEAAHSANTAAAGAAPAAGNSAVAAAVDGFGGSEESLQMPAGASDFAAVVGAAADASEELLQPPGNEACWASGFSFELCCHPRSVGNPACWDADFTYSACCRRPMTGRE